MGDALRPLGPLETALRELSAVERAGVFSRTPLDARALIASRPRRLELRTVYRLGSVAAVIAVAAGLWAWNASRGPGGHMTPGLLAAASPCDGTFFGCITGPRQAAGATCHGFDYDADGDIDMLDMRTYQLRCEGITR